MNTIRRAFVVALLAALAISTSALAQSRPDARAMTCNQAQSIIGQYGAVVLTTGRHTYDRYVAHGGYCSSPYVALPAWIATSDTPQCMLYSCQTRDDFFDDDWLRRR